MSLQPGQPDGREDGRGQGPCGGDGGDVGGQVEGEGHRLRQDYVVQVVIALIRPENAGGQSIGSVDYNNVL